jgi:hypothetical protein
MNGCIPNKICHFSLYSCFRLPSTQAVTTLKHVYQKLGMSIPQQAHEGRGCPEQSPKLSDDIGPPLILLQDLTTLSKDLVLFDIN